MVVAVVGSPLFGRVPILRSVFSIGLVSPTRKPLAKKIGRLKVLVVNY